MIRSPHPAGGEAGWVVSEVVETEEHAGKGLQSGALGLWGNVTIGLASTAPAYSLAATLGYVVIEVGDKAPAMFLLAFIPMLLVAVAYRELNRAAPDCGTTFTWGTKALGPWVGWLGGWGVAVSAIIVLANVAEIAGTYLLLFFGADYLAENAIVRVGLGIVFIVVMTWISYRGIVLSERIQIVLVSFQFIVLVLLSVLALVKVSNGTAGEQAVPPTLEQLSPFGLDPGAVATAVILCIFIYWGWDACLAVTEETKDADRTPGRAALIATVILLATYVLVAYAVGSFAGLRRGGHRSGQRGERRRHPDHRRGAGTGRDHDLGAAAHRVGLGGRIDPDHDSADRPRGTGHGGLQGNSGQVRRGEPALQDAGVRDAGDGHHGDRLLPAAVADQHQCSGRLDRFARAGRGVLLRHHRVRLRGLLPAHPVQQRPELLPARAAPADRLHSGWWPRSS